MKVGTATDTDLCKEGPPREGMDTPFPTTCMPEKGVGMMCERFVYTLSHRHRHRHRHRHGHRNRHRHRHRHTIQDGSMRVLVVGQKRMTLAR